MRVQIEAQPAQLNHSRASASFTQNNALSEIDDLTTPTAMQLARSTTKQVAIRQQLADAIEKHLPNSTAAAHHRYVAAAMSAYADPVSVVKFTYPVLSNGAQLRSMVNVLIEEHAIAFARENHAVLARLPDNAAIARAFIFNKEASLRKHLNHHDLLVMGAATGGPWQLYCFPKLDKVEAQYLDRVKHDRSIGAEFLNQATRPENRADSERHYTPPTYTNG